MSESERTASNTSGVGPGSIPRRVELPTDPASRDEQRRRRRRKRRLTAALWVLGWIGAVIVVCALAIFVVQGLERGQGLGQSGPQSYSADLHTEALSWPNANGCALHDGAYHVAPLGTSNGIVCFAPTGSYQNFDLQVTARVDAGTTHGVYGLVFRSPDSGDGYVFVLDDTGRSAVLGTVSLGSVSALSNAWPVSSAASGTPAAPAPRATATSGASAASAAHRLEVRAQGDTFTCFVDGHQVGIFSDARYTAGVAGLYVSSPGEDIAFTDFAISPLS